MDAGKARKRRIPHQTFYGRIVYDRPTHYFTIDDIARIARKLPDIGNTRDAIRYLSMVGSIMVNICRPISKKMQIFEFTSGLVEQIYYVVEGFFDMLSKTSSSFILEYLNIVKKQETLPPVEPSVVVQTILDVKEVYSLGYMKQWQDPVTGILWVPVDSVRQGLYEEETKPI